MSDSALVEYRNLTKNYSRRKGKIAKITIHITDSVTSVKNCVDYFTNPAIGASSQYVIGNKGEIGQSVLECNRAWTSSNSANDNVAVTIEVINSSTNEPKPISDAAYDSLIKLCVDICQRNGIPSVYYDGTPNGVLTEHRMFAAKSCPGTYIHNMLVNGKIPRDINEGLKNGQILPENGGFKYAGLDYSPVFDPAYYRAKYADLGAAGLTSDSQLWAHFVKFGMDEARQACESFNPQTYRKTFPDLNAAFDDDWECYYKHYIMCGREEIASGKRGKYSA